MGDNMEEDTIEISEVGNLLDKHDKIVGPNGTRYTIDDVMVSINSGTYFYYIVEVGGHEQKTMDGSVIEANYDKIRR